MGIVRRQSIYNTFLLYSGIGIGFLSKVLILYFLPIEEYGMLGLLTSAMVIGSELSQFGVARMVYRFFPHYKRSETGEGAFTTFVALYTLTGYLVAVLLVLLFRSSLLQTFGENSPLFVSQFYLLIPAVLAHTLYRVGEAMARSHFRSVLPTFAQEVLVRLSQMGIVLLYAFGYIRFEHFALGYMMSFFISGTLIIAYLIQQGKLRINLKLGYLRPRVLKVLVRYCLITSLAFVAYFMVLRVDQFMIGSMISEAAAGAYDIAYYLVILLLTPARSMAGIVMPLFADHLKARRMDEVRKLHRRGSATSLVLAQLIFMLMYVNSETAFGLFPKVADARSVLLYLGVGNMTTSLSMGLRFIVINSRYYQFDLITNLLLIVVVVSSNYVMIPLMGIDGAAIATSVSLMLYNGVTFFFAWKKFGIHSLTRNTLLTFLLGGVSIWLGLHIPTLENPWLDMIMRTALMLPFYLGIAIGLRLSPDLNDAATLALKKVGLRR